MKTKNSKKLTLLLATALILYLPMFGGCQKSETNKKRDNGGTLPLIGTTWKLVGFADSERNSFELAKPSGKETYLLKFKEDGSISGSTSTNQARGKFVLSDKDKSLSIMEFTNVTEINELLMVTATLMLLRKYLLIKFQQKTYSSIMKKTPICCFNLWINK